MRRLLAAGALLAALLVLSTQAGAAQRQPDKVRLTGHPVWTLAMAWPRVVYASGKEGATETIHIWNVVTGATSVVKSGRHGFATHYTAEIAIAGQRLAWIRAQQSGNTELDHWLYTAPLVGRSAHLLRRALGYADTGCGVAGPQIGGLVGSGNTLAVSTWTVNDADYSASATHLNLITPRGLRTIATGPHAIVSESADGGHIAVLPRSKVKATPDGCVSFSPPASVAVYSTSGTLLKTISLGAPASTTIGYQLALSDNRLVVLTTGLNEPSGPAIVTLTVYDWTTGSLQHTWPVAIPQYPGEVNFDVYGHLAAVEGPGRLHLVDLNTGKDVVIAPSSGTVSPAAIGPRGLVYAVNPHNTGRLVFVPIAKLLRLTSQ